MSESPEFSFVLPCLNEELTLEVCVNKCFQSAREHNLDVEVIVADNGSTDGSVALAEKLGARVVHVARKGYGSALIAGITNARGKYVIMGDADDSYDFSDVGEFVKHLRDGADFVIGNRFKGGVQKGAMPPLHRYLGNPVLSFLGRIFYNTKIGDFHCGLRGFDRAKILSLNLKCPGMEFASEMICKAVMQNLTIVETPIKLYPDGRDRAPHLRSWRDGWRHLRFLLIHSPNWLFIYPGLLLTALGAAGGAALMMGPIRIGGVVLDVHTLVYFATVLLIGLQMLSLGAFTKIFHQRLYSTKTRLPLLASITLERGLIVGLILVAMGIIGSLVSVAGWQEVQFGDLDPSTVLRQVIPSATAILAGGLLIVNAFTLGVIESLTDLEASS